MIRIKIGLLLLLSLTVLSVKANNNESIKLDSLNNVLKSNPKNDTLLARTYVELSNILYVSSNDTLIALAKKALYHLEKPAITALKNHSIIDLKAQACNNLGYGYKSEGKVEEAVKYYKKSIGLYTEIGDKAGISSVLNNIGMIYELNGNIPLAVENYQESLTLLQEIDDKYGLATVFNNLGFVNKAQGDYDGALKYYNKSLKIREEIGDQRGVATSLNNIAGVHLSKNEIDLAQNAYVKSMLIRKEINDIKGVANSLCNIGSVFELKNENDSALHYFQNSIAIYQDIKNTLGLVKPYLGVAEIYADDGNMNEALIYTKKAMEISKELGFPELIVKSAELLSNIYEKQGNGKEALKMFKLHILMRDSINNQESQKATVQQQARYEYEKQKAVDDAKHDKQIAIEQEAKAKQKIITYATAGGLGLVVIFLVFVFNRLQVTKKQKIVIETQKLEVEKQKTVVELAHSELEEKNQEILDSITYAKRIQNAILPPLKVVKEYLTQSFILYEPKDIVAGDFYWLEHRANIVLFAAADCTGHGVPGAMVSVVCNNALNRSVREYGLVDPAKILDKTREIVIQEFEKSDDEVKDGMDIALCSLEGSTLKYAGANNPLWIIRNQEIIEIKANKQPIGQYDNPLPYTTHAVELQKGDSIYIFSDGYVDQFGGKKGKKFKAQSFRTLLLSIQDKEMEEQQVIIKNTFEHWKGNLEQIDDVCVIGVKI